MRHRSADSAAHMSMGGLASGSPTIVDFEGTNFERKTVLSSVRSYVAYPISSRRMRSRVASTTLQQNPGQEDQWCATFQPFGFLGTYALLYGAFGVQSPFVPALLGERGLPA